MPYEERNILFYFNELQDMFAEHRDILKKVKDLSGIKPRDVLVKEILHSSKAYAAPTEQVARFSKHIDIPKDDRHTLFLGSKKSLLSEQSVCFCLPDDVFLEILIAACINQGIRLPKNAEREVLIRDLTVGVRMTLSSNRISLEDPI